MLNYTAVRTHFQENRPEVWEETLLMAPRKIFTGVKVLHEEAAGLYDERSSAQQKQWHKTFDEEMGLPHRLDSYHVKFPSTGLQDSTIVAFKTE